MWLLATSALFIASVNGQDLPPSCDSKVFCQGELLDRVQNARLFPDSKTFVDMKMLQSENETVAKFQQLLDDTSNAPTKEEIQKFVNESFAVGDELENWIPTDHQTSPTFLDQIKDPKLRQFASDVNGIWPSLGRHIKAEVSENPDRYSIIPVPNGFIIPGGRFREIYYWDSYWIIEGLLICGMKETARGMIENLMALVKKLGHVPNGSRWYYKERSQPPLLTPMAALYFRETQDKEWVKANLEVLETELNYWQINQSVEVETDFNKHTLFRFYAPSAGPRPESYYEDYESSQTFDSEARKQEFFTDIKSAAESGWDFSSRWFIDHEGGNSGNLTNIRTQFIIPVDLNSFLAGAMQTLGDFKAIVGDRAGAINWWQKARYLRDSIDEVLFSKKDGMWFDYDTLNRKHRKYFYPTNLAPLWAGAIDRQKIWAYTPGIQRYLVKSQGLTYPGGIPTSLLNTGEQWDFPNAWPPLVSIAIGAMEKLGTKRSRRWAKEAAQRWVTSNYLGYQKTKTMFEKYDAVIPGLIGGGGEYNAQEGFGWTNGVVFELLSKYGRVLKLDDADTNETIDTKSESDDDDEGSSTGVTLTEDAS